MFSHDYRFFLVRVYFCINPRRFETNGLDLKSDSLEETCEYVTNASTYSCTTEHERLLLVYAYADFRLCRSAYML